MITSNDEYMKGTAPSIWVEAVTYNQLNLSPVQKRGFIELAYVVTGSINCRIKGGDSKPLSADDIIIINPEEQYTLSIPSSKEAEILRCYFLPKLIQQIYIADLSISSVLNSFDIQSLLNDRKRIGSPIKLEKSNALNIKQILINMKEALDSKIYNSHSILWLRLMEILILLSQIPNEHENPKSANTFQTNKFDNQKVQLIKNINNYLLQYYNEKISTAVVANVFHISIRHLNRIYKQYTGLTVTEMIHQIRIDKAKHYLIHSDDKVINVAMKVGYEDPAFFSRLFRRKVGCSPGYYKKSYSNSLYSS